MTRRSSSTFPGWTFIRQKLTCCAAMGLPPSLNRLPAAAAGHGGDLPAVRLLTIVLDVDHLTTLPVDGQLENVRPGVMAGGVEPEMRLAQMSWLYLRIENAFCLCQRSGEEMTVRIYDGAVAGVDPIMARRVELFVLEGVRDSFRTHGDA